MLFLIFAIEIRTIAVRFCMGSLIYFSMTDISKQIADSLQFTMLPENVIKELFAEISELKSMIKKKTEDEVKSQWIESTEARKMLGVSPKTWQVYRDERRIPFVQFGRKIFFKKGDLDNFMNKHYIPSRES